MEAKELRIRNRFENSYSNYSTVLSIEIDPNSLDYVIIDEDASMHEIDKCKPIELNEEWLKRFGFTNYEWCNDCAFIKCNGQHMMLRFYGGVWHCFKTTVSKDSKGHKMSQGKDIVHDGHIKYVHQLQNLYFALTGKELEITKP